VTVHVTRPPFGSDNSCRAAKADGETAGLEADDPSSAPKDPERPTGKVGLFHFLLFFSFQQNNRINSSFTCFLFPYYFP